MAPESSTETITVAVEPRPLESLSPTQLHQWKMTGEIPNEEPAKKESSAAEVTEPKPEAKAKPAAESEPAQRQQEPKPSKLGYGDLRKKVREQEAEIQRLKGAAPASESPRVEAEPAKTEDLRTRPQIEDKDKDGKPKYTTMEEFFEDLADWKADQKIADWQKNETKRQQEQRVAAENREVETSWRKRVDASMKLHDDFKDALDPENGPGSQWQEGSLLDRWVLESDMGAEILYYFHKHPDEIQRIGLMKPLQASRELTKLEDRLQGENTSKAPPVEAKPEPKATKAPPPTKEVGGRGTTATDEVSKAVADDDFTAFKNSANRADLARKKR